MELYACSIPAIHSILLRFYRKTDIEKDRKILIIHSSLQFMHTTPNSSALITAYMLKSPLTPKLYYKKMKYATIHTL